MANAGFDVPSWLRVLINESGWLKLLKNVGFRAAEPIKFDSLKRENRLSVAAGFRNGLVCVAASAAAFCSRAL